MSFWPTVPPPLPPQILAFVLVCLIAYKPRDFLTPVHLNDNNYDDSMVEIETALQAQRKFGFLNGTITTHIPPCTDADWTVIHAMFVSLIMNTITIESRRENDMLHQLLMGLNTKYYGQLHRNILAQDPLPPLNRVYHWPFNMNGPTRKLIGMGSKQDELYYFKEETVSIQTIIVDEETSSLALWHSRMGHLKRK
ncbi:hypothetical protein V6N11_069095 [Hibiscus sabdariffa]|uniref:Retrotransposon Copia-like N-terminal domain-containing protein n=1 Tax=Hibiscus sabdariffa TaxID=183260 RepID=A0ABR2A5N1_9ROSI